MTDRKFTPPTEFPTEYVTSDDCRAVILGRMPYDEYPYVGYIVYKTGGCVAHQWKKGGDGGPLSNLHDLPKKRVQWANDYDGFPGGSWCHTREEADKSVAARRIAVIRREWVEGQEPEYFKEEV